MLGSDRHMTPETKEKLSKSLKAKWASGTRKSNPPQTYIKASATHKQGFADGRRVARQLAPEQAKAMFASRSKEKMLEINRRIGEMQRGVPNPPGQALKGQNIGRLAIGF